MDKKLEAAWAARAADLPLKTPDEALILASIVEKETGKAQDRSEISAVFVNRLRIGMPLQTDPSVIYGMGTRFDGNLRKKDLQTDSPGTPICAADSAGADRDAGQGRLRGGAASAKQVMYFVSRGDGTSQFSNSLDEHNRAVNRYQRGTDPNQRASNEGTFLTLEASMVPANRATSTRSSAVQGAGPSGDAPANRAARRWPRPCARRSSNSRWTR
jgi:UPF0755 protein